MGVYRGRVVVQLDSIGVLFLVQVFPDRGDNLLSINDLSSDVESHTYYFTWVRLHLHPIFVSHGITGFAA